ncbi:MAG: M48 family metalloprotease [Nitrospiria bacterium]
MREKSHFRFNLLLLFTLVFLLSCAGGRSHRNPETTEQSPQTKSTDQALSQDPDPKKALGKQFLQAARKEFTFVKDPEIVTTVNQVGRRILEGIGEDPSDYHFLIVKQNQANAFAIPGGYIFIFDGLLSKLGSVDALAGVLAHEIAHITRNHHFKDAKKEGAINLATMAAVIGAVLAGKGEEAASVIAPAANITLKLGFSRKNEEEADFFAIKYLQKTGYNPVGLSDFFKTLAFYKRFAGAPIPAYLSTHPGVEGRRAKVDAFLRNRSIKRKINPEVQDWGRLLTILRAEEGEEVDLSTDPSGKGQDALSEERRHYLSGLFALKSGRLKQAVREYREALRLHPDHPLYYADLSWVYTRLGKADLAREAALKSLQLSKEEAAPHAVLGMIAQAEEHHEEAIEHLHAAITRSPNDPFLHLQMAQSLHALSMSVKEYFHLGRYYRLDLEPEKALRQLNKARLKAEKESPLLKSIQREIREIQREGI